MTIVSRQDFSDFYILSALSHVIEADNRVDLIRHRNRLIKQIMDYYIPNVRVALVQEASHKEQRFYPKSKQKQDGLKKNLGLTEERYNSIDNQLYFNELSNQGFIDIFKYCDWANAFGGETWANIATLHHELVSWKNILTNEYGWNSHLLVRDHMSGEFNNKIHKVMVVIDRLHQAEHNTGSIFTKFGEMSHWLNLALNEKAIKSSINVLMNHASSKVAIAAKEVDIDDSSVEEIERQFGETILARAQIKYDKRALSTMNSAIGSAKELFQNGHYSEERYEEYTKRAIEEYSNRGLVIDNSNPIMSEFYTFVNYNQREARGIIRELFKQGKDKSKDKVYNQMSVLEAIMNNSSGIKRLFINSDKTFLYLLNGNYDLSKYVIAYLIDCSGGVSVEAALTDTSQLPVILDFIYENYENFVKNNNPKINILYAWLCKAKYDISKLTKPKKIDAPYKKINSHETFETDEKIALPYDAKTFAIKYSGQEIMALGSYAETLGEWASYVPLGKVIGYEKNNVLYTPSIEMKAHNYLGNSIHFLGNGVLTTTNKPEKYYLIFYGDMKLHAPYGLKKDGMPKKKPGKKKNI